MTLKFLDNLLLLYIHKQETNSLDLISMAKEFVSANSRRKVILEIFNLAMSI